MTDNDVYRSTHWQGEEGMEIMPMRVTSRNVLKVYRVVEEKQRRQAKWYNLAWWLDHVWGVVLGLRRGTADA